MRSMYDYKNRTALVTGASSGIGAAFARALAARGVAALVLVARSADRLEALAAELRGGGDGGGEHGTRVEVVSADLGDAEAPAGVKAETDARGLAVDLLVNNAGIGSYGYFEERDAAGEQEIVAVNVAAVVALTRRYLPEMVARGAGAILNVASTAAFQPVPFMTTYAATKAFVLSFSEALWAENRGRGVRVVCLCPGKTGTNFAEHLESGRGRFERLRQSTPEEVAEGGLRALDGNASFVVVGRANYAGALGVRLLPRSVAARAAGALFRPLPERGGATAGRRVAGGVALGLGAGALLLAYARRRRGG